MVIAPPVIHFIHDIHSSFIYEPRWFVASTCCFPDTGASGVAGGLITRLLISSEGGTDVESEISMELSPRLLGDAVCFWA